MIAVPDPDETSRIAITGTKLFLLGFLFVVAGIGLDLDGVILLGLLIGVRALFVE